jgi:hypothetical protein
MPLQGRTTIMKSYRQVLLSRVPEGQRSSARALVQFHGLHTLRALLQKLEGGPPTTPPPTRPVIGVTSEGTGLSAVFVVKVLGFLPAPWSLFESRVLERPVHNVFFQINATSDGKIEIRISIPKEGERSTALLTESNKTKGWALLRTSVVRSETTPLMIRRGASRRTHACRH